MKETPMCIAKNHKNTNVVEYFTQLGKKKLKRLNINDIIARYMTLLEEEEEEEEYDVNLDDTIPGKKDDADVSKIQKELGKGFIQINQIKNSIKQIENKIEEIENEFDFEEDLIETKIFEPPNIENKSDESITQEIQSIFQDISKKMNSIFCKVNYLEEQLEIENEDNKKKTEEEETNDQDEDNKKTPEEEETNDQDENKPKDPKIEIIETHDLSPAQQNSESNDQNDKDDSQNKKKSNIEADNSKQDDNRTEINDDEPFQIDSNHFLFLGGKSNKNCRICGSIRSSPCSKCHNWFCYICEKSRLHEKMHT